MKPNCEHPCIKDAYPARAQYQSGDAVEIEIELGGADAPPEDLEVVVEVMALERQVARFVERLGRMSGSGCVTVTVDLCAAAPGNFGVDVSLAAGGRTLDTISTAYDVVLCWSDAPRYGFLSGFSPEDEVDAADVEQLRKYHIAAVQFYDWMYRHHELLPPEDTFIDPLGRVLSLSAVREKIALCHAYGMKAMAYGAVYTASPEFAAAHPEMMLMRNDGAPELFANGWQHIMDVSAGSAWAGHIAGQFARAVREVDFDGIHMDTYGFPKTAFARSGGDERFVRLQEELPKLINAVKEATCRVKSGAGALFNAVGNWPAADVARSRVDASYIEVWDPADRYVHLNEIIKNARQSGGKPVILAAYPSAFKDGPQEQAEGALLYLQAVLFASGGYHIELGECNSVLCDPYFVEHAAIRPGFERTLRNWYDFIVRYGNLLYDPALTDVSMTHAGGINEEYAFSGGVFSSCGEPGKIWTIVKERPGAKLIHLINLTGMMSDRWNEGKAPARSVRDISVRVLDNERVESVWMASPDRNCCRMEKLPFSTATSNRGRIIEFVVPELCYWDMVYMHTEY